MKFVFPIENMTAEMLYARNHGGESGFYPIGRNNSYHGGIHIEGELPVVAIADGIIIAYRVCRKYHEEPVGEANYRYSNCFILIRHEVKTPKGRKFVFYSTYNHLCPWDEFTEEQKQRLPAPFSKPGFRITAKKLNMRSSMDASDDRNIIKTSELKKGDEVVAADVNGKWAKKEGGSEFFIHDLFATPLSIPKPPQFDAVTACELPVKAGDLIGYTGLYEMKGLPENYCMVHIEVFAGKDIEKLIGTSGTNGKTAEDTSRTGTEADLIDWPGFTIAKEEGAAANNPVIDFKKLTPFFKQIIDKINTNKDNEISDQELMIAMKQPELTGKLSRLICYHQSEWWVDDGMSIWDMIFKRIGKKASEKMKTRLDNLCWWNDVAKKAKDFPSSPNVYHWNPVAFVERMQRIGVDMSFGFKDGVSGELALTEAQKIALKISEDFEGGGYKSIVGNFDGQGISWGIMQWNFGQGTLAPLMKKFRQSSESEFKNCFGNDDAKFNAFVAILDKTTAEQLEWASGVQNNNVVKPEWKAIFNNIGDVAEFQTIQDDEAISMNHPLATGKIDWLKSQFPEFFTSVTLRTYVALFDLSNQHGTLKETVQNQLVDYWNGHPPKSQLEVVEKTCIMRGLAGKSEFRADSISRRLGILNGKKVKVDSSLDASIPNSAERTNSKYDLLTPNRLITGME